MNTFISYLVSSRWGGNKTTRSYRTGLFAVVSAALIFGSFGVGKSQAAVIGPEHSLVGIKIYDKATIVLKKFGQPTKVITSSQGGNPYGGMQPGSAMQGMPGMPESGDSMSEGAAAPGEFSPSGLKNSPYNTDPIPAPNESILRYVKPGGVRIDFTVDKDGRVVQITVAGLKSNAKTSRGIILGSSYTQVLNKYGYPESQTNKNMGKVLLADYNQKFHVAFQFIGMKVVSITVAAIE
jgi:hypothetical protein